MVQKSIKIGHRKWLENDPGVVKQRSKIVIINNANSNGLVKFLHAILTTYFNLKVP